MWKMKHMNILQNLARAVDILHSNAEFPYSGWNKTEPNITSVLGGREEGEPQKQQLL